MAGVMCDEHAHHMVEMVAIEDWEPIQTFRANAKSIATLTPPEPARPAAGESSGSRADELSFQDRLIAAEAERLADADGGAELVNGRQVLHGQRPG